MERLKVAELLSEEERLLKLIRSTYVDPTGASTVITDGLVNPELYASTNPRILWLLKEPYDGGDARTGGGWCLCKDLLLAKTDMMARKPAFQPICYITHGILSGQHDWDAMQWLRDSEQIRHSLRSIAFINVSKLPGLKTSMNNEIVAAYRKYRATILSQIRAYSPEIIFACAPHVHPVAQDLGLDSRPWREIGTAAVRIGSQGQRLVWVYHPSQRTKGITRLRYVNDAIEAATMPL